MFKRPDLSMSLQIVSFENILYNDHMNYYTFLVENEIQLRVLFCYFILFKTNNMMHIKLFIEKIHSIVQ